MHQREIMHLFNFYVVYARIEISFWSYKLHQLKRQISFIYKLKKNVSKKKYSDDKMIESYIPKSCLLRVFLGHQFIKFRNPEKLFYIFFLCVISLFHFILLDLLCLLRPK